MGKKEEEGHATKKCETSKFDEKWPTFLYFSGVWVLGFVETKPRAKQTPPLRLHWGFCERVVRSSWGFETSFIQCPNI